MKVTIGGFDGMHLAHTELIKKSDTYIVIEKNSTLTPYFDRIFYDSKMLQLFELENIKHLQKEEFIEILKSLNVKKVIIGYDFKFGKNRSGDVEDLKKAFEVKVVEEIKYKNIPIHSHVIRTFIKNNEITKANELLGHSYKIKGLRIKGQGLGNRELLPTLNLKLLHSYTLPEGVFLTKTNGFFSLTFIGRRSTDGNFSIETHILNEKWKIENGKLINIEFIDFIRNNIKFNDLKELKKQILKDKELALERLKNYKHRNTHYYR